MKTLIAALLITTTAFSQQCPHPGCKGYLLSVSEYGWTDFQQFDTDDDGRKYIGWSETMAWVATDKRRIAYANICTATKASFDSPEDLPYHTTYTTNVNYSWRFPMPLKEGPQTNVVRILEVTMPCTVTKGCGGTMASITNLIRIDIKGELRSFSRVPLIHLHQCTGCSNFLWFTNAYPYAITNR